MTSADDMASEEPCALGDLRIRINRLTDPNQVWQFDGELINYEVDPCRTIKLVMTPTYNIPNIDEAAKRAMMTHPAKSLVLLPAIRHLEKQISSFRSAQTNCEFQVNFVTSELEEEIARLRRKVEELQQHEKRADDVPVVTASVVEPVAGAAPHAAVDTDLLLEVQRKYGEAQKLLAERTKMLDELTREKPKIEQDAEEKLRRELARNEQEAEEKLRRELARTEQEAEEKLRRELARNEQEAEEKLRRELARRDEDCSARLAQRELDFADHLKAEVEKVTSQRKTQDRLVSKEFKRLNEDIKRHNEEIEKQNQIIANLRNQALKRTRDDAERRLENDDAKRNRPDPQPHVLRKPPPPPPKMNLRPVQLPKAVIPPPSCHTYGETSSSSSQLASLEAPRPRTETSQMNNNHVPNNKPKRMMPGVPLRAVKKEQLSSPREGYLFRRLGTGFKRHKGGYSLKPRTPRKPRPEN